MLFLLSEVTYDSEIKWCLLKNPPANAGDVGSIPGLGRSPGKGNGNPLQHSQFNRSVMSDSLRPHGLHVRSPCPSPTPGVYSHSCPLSQWCHPTISSSVDPSSFYLQSFPASGSFPVVRSFYCVLSYPQPQVSSKTLSEWHYFLCQRWEKRA